jgi:uncharacterized RDD family membrane protein YckC
MDEHVSIETPEHIEFTFQLAGLGTRFIAVLIDHLIQGFILGFALLVGLLSAGAVASLWTEASLWVIFGLLLLLFVVFWGYFTYFETTSNGQTPGKRIAGIRVVRDDGTPITFFDAMIRNLVRLVDFLPAYYTIGVIAVFVSPQNKRLGDYAAGTIVVKERTTPMPAPATADADADAAPVAARSPQLAAAVRAVVGRLSPEELQVVERYVARKIQLNPPARASLARKIAAPLIRKLSIDGIAATDEEVLETIAEVAAQRRSAL